VESDGDDSAQLINELSIYRQFFEHADLGFGVAISERIELVNPAMARMHGYEPAELRGKPISVLKADAATLPVSIRKAEINGRFVFEDVHRRRDGSTFQARIVVASVADDAGGPLYRTIVVEDITEQKRTERRQGRLQEQLLSAQKMESVGQLAGGVAHDFNNLLAAVLITAQAAMRRTESPRLRAAFETIEQAAQRGENLTRQLLTYAGHGNIELSLLDLSSVVRELGELLDASLKRSIEIDYSLADDLHAVRGGATQIRQLVMNLIVNAADAMQDRSGLVSVRTYGVRGPISPPERAVLRGMLVEGDAVCVEVCDDGCGMERDAIDGMFEPFATTKGPGRGMGLASVIGIVNSHGAQIMVESVLGVGTTVTVSFPSGGPLPARPTEHLAEPDTRWSQHGVALVADDDPLVLGAVADALELAGMTVIKATDGLDALAKFEKDREKIDLVLLDVTMPGLDGIRALRQLHARGCKAPVILASGFADHITIPADLGCTEFLSKPFETDDLLATVQRVIKQARRR
jgi:PAS domain S-box-containing protein